MSRHPAYFSWAPSSYLPQHHRHSGKATRGYILEAQKHQQPGQVSQASSSSGISIFKISHSSCSRIKLSLNKVDINKYHHEPMPAPGLHLPGSPGAQHGTTWDRSRGTKHLLKLWKDSLSGWSAMRHPSCHIWSQYRLHCQVVVPCRSCVWCHQCLSSESIFNLVLGLNWKYTKPTVRRLMYDINDNMIYLGRKNKERKRNHSEDSSLQIQEWKQPPRDHFRNMPCRSSPSTSRCANRAFSVPHPVPNMASGCQRHQKVAPL